jgi:tetratricopeptide (TPR) repeat protein
MTHRRGWRRGATFIPLFVSVLLLGACQATAEFTSQAKQWLTEPASARSGRGSAGRLLQVTPPRPFRQADCYLDPFPTDRGAPDIERLSNDGLSDVVRLCRTPPPRRDPATFNRQLANSYFHTGKAMRALGNSAEAARLLMLAANTVDPGQTSRVRDSAMIELVRAQRDMGAIDDGLLDLLARRNVNDRAVDYELAQRALLRARRPEVASDIAALRSLRLLALGYLRTFRHPDTSPGADQYVYWRGPELLAEVANDLGKDALENLPPTETNTGQAISYFTDAAEAASQLRGRTQWDGAAASIFVNLGRSHLRLAGLRRGASAANLECGVGGAQLQPGERDALRDAASAFERARERAPSSPDVRWGAGCVLLALGNAPAAATEFQYAVDHPSTDAPPIVPRWQHHVALARAQAATGQIALAERSYTTALAGQPDPATVVQIQLDMADMYRRVAARLTGGERERLLQAALDRLDWAVGAPRDQSGAVIRDRSGRPNRNPEVDTTRPRNPDAYLSRGEILFDMGDLQYAALNLEVAARATGGTRGPANSKLSELEERRRRAAEAVDYADEAVSTDRNNPEYRRRACLVRIRLWDRLGAGLRERGALYCAAGASNDSHEFAEHLLYEGMFHLRVTYPPTRGGDQSRAWASALDAFTRGLNSLGESGRDPELWARLARGQNRALYCGGFGGAMEAIAADPGDPLFAEQARNYFAENGFAECARRRP